MAEIAAAPAYTAGTLKLASNSYTGHATRAVLKPTPVNTITRDIAGVDHIVAGKSSFALEIDLNQDHTTANSMSQFILANDGLVVAAELVVAGGGKYTFSVAVSAGDAGGTGGEIGTATVSWPATYPVYTPAA